MLDTLYAVWDLDCDDRASLVFLKPKMRLTLMLHMQLMSIAMQ